MARSWFKRAHRTHGLDQPAGEGYRHLISGQADQRAHQDKAWSLFAELCSSVPDPMKRAELLGVTQELEAAWQRGAAAPLLRAHRQRLERALRSPEGLTNR
jgi:hypothetical protein